MDTRIDKDRYEVLRKRDRRGYLILFHVLLAEKALGKPLPKGAEVHHHNEIKNDNRNCNLVVCPDRAYHKLLHIRIRAKAACGNPTWLKCGYCKKYSDPKTMYFNKNNRSALHPSCSSERQKKRYANNPALRAKRNAYSHSYYKNNREKILRILRDKYIKIKDR